LKFKIWIKLKHLRFTAVKDTNCAEPTKKEEKGEKGRSGSYGIPNSSRENINFNRRFPALGVVGTKRKLKGKQRDK